MLVVLVSFVHAEASSRATLLFPLAFAFTFEDELVADVHVIEYIWSFSWRRLWLERDSACLVALLYSYSLGGGSLFSRGVWIYLAQIDFVVTHICSDGLRCYSNVQEGNWVANCLAFRACNIIAPT